ncbi:MAG: UDP-N-acetylmuramoyl-tripeptide--D-alanyl-D-alanine ligase [Kiritimatiellae bacterium]|nr:UDP-N-acetylmuramoyl-tripeptide--D-alanyl-D-alanine ligase [Kiritimatiellia bacterium]
MFDSGEIAKWADGSWTSAPRGVIKGFCFDSRSVRPGDVFFALKSETADGHNYVLKALDAGAAGAMVRADWNPPGVDTASLPLLRVNDPLKAMHAVAAAWRRKVGPFIVGVTGSVGKSTVKTWTASLIAEQFRTASTIANFNNDIGLPISLTSMAPDTEKGVFEVGMNHKGELAPLCRTLAPNAAIITAIGPVHIEFFPSVEAIADEKAELLRALPPDGFAVLDVASPWYPILLGATRARVVTVRVREGNRVAEANYEARVVDPLSGSFEVFGRSVPSSAKVVTGFPGAHNVLNALYAIAAAHECGVPWEKVLHGVANLPSMKMRWERETIDGATWVNDAYNANPIAMAASLRTFNGTVGGAGRRIYVLGEMRELGADSRRFHDEIGELVGELGGEVFVGVGEAGGWMIDAAIAHGFTGEAVRVPDAAAAGRALAELLREGDNVLLKASHGVALENVLPAYRKSKAQSEK